MSHCGEASVSLHSSTSGWGEVGQRYELLQAMQPVLQRIAKDAVQRENSRTLPYAEVADLRATGFLRARIGRESGGFAASLPDLFELVIKVAEADPNVAQVFRSHFGFVEHVLTVADQTRKRTWLERLARGDLVASAATEVGGASTDALATSVTSIDGQWRLYGKKAYATGAMFADWIEVEAEWGDIKEGAVAVRRDEPGVSVLDDWTGMGQTISASGSVVFSNVLVDPAEFVRGDPFPYYESFYQLYLLAILAGIGRAASNDVAALVGSRTRTFSHGNTQAPRRDPQLLQIVGEVRSSAYAAGACVLHAAQALEAASLELHTGKLSDDALCRADVEVWQAQCVVSQLVLAATSRVFDALGASSTLTQVGLDRHWRNARTLATHNPVTYKARIVGDFAVNGTRPPGQWRVGTFGANVGLENSDSRG